MKEIKNSKTSKKQKRKRMRKKLGEITVSKFY